jgi:hypothetical protein
VTIRAKAFWHKGFQLSVTCVVCGCFSSSCGRSVDAGLAAWPRGAEAGSNDPYISNPTRERESPSSALEIPITVVLFGGGGRNARCGSGIVDPVRL